MSTGCTQRGLRWRRGQRRLCILAAAGFGTFEDPPAKMTYSGAYSGGAWELYVDGNDCGSTPPEGPRDEDGTGYGFLAATPLWDGKCFNKNCAREDGNRDGGKTGGWTKNYKKCNTVESETDLMFLDAESPNRRRRARVESGGLRNTNSPGRMHTNKSCNGPDLWRLQEVCFEWCAEEATRLGYGSINHPDTQYCCALKFGRTWAWTKSDGNFDYMCSLGTDGSPGFQSPDGNNFWTAIQVFSTSCSAEYADPAACASD